MWSIFVAYDYNMKTLKLINSIEMHHQIQFVGAATDWIQLNPESPIFSQNPVDLVFGIPNEFESADFKIIFEIVQYPVYICAVGKI